MKTSVTRLMGFVAALLIVLAACAKPNATSPQDNFVVGKLPDGGTIPAAPIATALQSEDEAAIPITSSDAVRGSRLAAVTVVIFSDFQCPFCSRMVPTMDRLAETYGAEQLRIVFKNDPLPFHEYAPLAAEVGQGVLEMNGNEAFWRYHNLAFEKQKDIGPDAILAWAALAGADERAIREGAQSKRWAPKIERDLKVSHAVGANGTPTSFIDGVELVGARGFEAFKEVIDQELEKSRVLSKQGIPKDQIYTRLTAQNFKSSAERIAAEKQKEEEEDRAETARVAADEKIIRKMPIGSSPVRGPATAEVTIVEFSDFQCPFCKQVEPTLERVRKEYGDKVRLVWRDLPLGFHPRAEPAAELARAARAQKGDAAFWAVHDALFNSQPALEDADLERIAQEQKLDVTKAMAAVRAHTYAAGIDADSEVADDFVVQGTPNFFINGHHLVGAIAFEKWKPIIDAELVRAEALSKSGTPKASLYDALVKDGQTPAEPEKKSVAAIPPGAPYFGAANAKVIIQEFSDFQCPFCGRVEPTLEALLKAFPGKIKLVWRDRPLGMHPDAPLAAEAAREAMKQKGNDGFQKMHRLLFANQKQLKRSDLEGYAQQVGLDMTKFNAALDTRAHKAIVDAEAKNADEAGIGGTPSFLIGPYYLSGAQPLPKFKNLVAKALALPADKLTPALPRPTTVPVGASAPAGKLLIVDTLVGKGREVKSGDKVKVHYVGKLTDGSEFDASRNRGNSPFSFQVGVGHVIKGWDQGVVGMKIGGKRKLTIPADLGYGDRGAGAKIPPKSTLVFDIELIDIE